MTHIEFSKKGGRVKSAVKTKAAKANLQKAQDALARKRKLASGPK
jgi:hypothetical protein